MIITDFHRRFDLFMTAADIGPSFFGVNSAAGVNGPGYIVPIHAVDFELVANQLLCVANDDAIGRRIEIDDIPWTP